MDIASLENNNIKISVIIPVYNVEKYLRQCLDSVINQTYKNLEIICIDDCSTDNSFQILKEYEKKDDRIIVLQNEVNSKLGLTRNHGMKYATGEYIHFLDSDDWLELDAYEKLAKIVEENGNIDILHFYWKNINVLTGDTYVSTYGNSKLLNRIINIHEHTDMVDNLKINAWSKLFNRRFLQDNNIKFNNYPCYEDVEFGMYVLTKANSIIFTPEYLINYRDKNPTSLTTNRYFYWEYLAKSWINAFSYFENINNYVVHKIFDFKLLHLYELFWEAYNKKTLNFQSGKNIIKELDEKILQKGFTSCNWYIYYKEILTQPEWLVVIKYKARKFTRKYCPTLNKILVYLRKHIKLLGKI